MRRFVLEKLSLQKWMRSVRSARFFRSESGQGMTEYLIIVALIAIAAVGVVTVFGNDVRQLFSAATGTLSGQSSTANTKKANVSDKTLKNFGTYSSSGD